jgi:hypothetical protein
VLQGVTRRSRMTPNVVSFERQLSVPDDRAGDRPADQPG